MRKYRVAHVITLDGEYFYIEQKTLFFGWHYVDKSICYSLDGAKKLLEKVAKCSQTVVYETKA